MADSEFLPDDDSGDSKDSFKDHMYKSSIPKPKSKLMEDDNMVQLPSYSKSTEDNLEQLQVIFQCSLCSFQAPDRHRLKRHFSSCIKLSQKSRDKSDIERIPVASNAAFRCEYCVFQTNTLVDLMNHKDLHASVIDMGLIECSHCTSTFFTLKELKKHMRSSNSYLKDVATVDNDIVYGGPEFETKRLDSSSGHADSNVMVEKSCDQELIQDIKEEPIDEELMEEERIAEESSVEEPIEEEVLVPEETGKLTFACDDFFCDVVTDNNGLYSCPCKMFQDRVRSNYLHHLETAHNGTPHTSRPKRPKEPKKEEDVLHSCLICSGTADTQMQLVVHMALDHKAGESINCPKPTCVFETDSRDKIISHLKRVHSMKNDLFYPLNYVQKAATQTWQCRKCVHVSKNEICLKLHEIFEHFQDSNGPFECPFSSCSTFIRRKKILKGHVEKVHRTKLDDALKFYDIAELIFNCPKCFFKSKTDLEMQVHNAMHHKPRSKQFYDCPVGRLCDFSTMYRRCLKKHLQTAHELGDEYFQKFEPLPNPVDLAVSATSHDHTSPWSCKKCIFKSDSELAIKYHKLVYHQTSFKRSFECPIDQCLFRTKHKQHVKRHLICVHKLDNRLFPKILPTLDKDAKEGEMDGKQGEIQKHYDIINAGKGKSTEGFKEVTVIESNLEEKPLATWRNISGAYTCQFCEYYNCNRAFSMQRHVKNCHPKEECNTCDTIVLGKYQLFLHDCLIHRDSTSMLHWTLKCTICSFTGSTDQSHKHGSGHRVAKVTFRTVTKESPFKFGYITFRYKKNEEHKISQKKIDGCDENTNLEGSKIRYRSVLRGPPGTFLTFLDNAETEFGCIAPSAIKVLDWTMSDEEEPLEPPKEQPVQQQGSNETITIQFADESDTEIETKNNNHSPEEKKESASTSDSLLIKKSEFLPCNICTYETQDKAKMHIHQLLLHCSTKDNPGTFNCHCPMKKCDFKTLYKNNFKRHIVDFHKFKLADFNEDDHDAKVQRREQEVKKKASKSFSEEKESMVDKDHSESKPARVHQCPEKNCTYSSQRLSDMVTHHMRAHSVLELCNPMYKCPNSQCTFTTENKKSLKKHLTVFHKIGETKVAQMEDTITKCFVCPKCLFQTENREELKEHFWDNHYAKTEETVLAEVPKIIEESRNWRLKCSLCPHQTTSKKSAYTHGSKHHRIAGVSEVVFRKYLGNQQKSIVKFRYSGKIYRCNKCAHVASSRTDLYRHNLRHHKDNFAKSSLDQIAEENQQQPMSVKTNDDVVTQGINIPTARKDDLGIKQMDKRAHEETVSRMQLRSKKNTAKRKYEPEAVKDTKAAKISKQGRAELEDNDDSDIAGAEDNSIGEEEQSGSYSIEELQQIIGIPTENQSTTKGETQVTIDADWIAALEEDILNDDDAIKNADKNEVIRIEITEDADEEGSREEATIDPFSGELILPSNESQESSGSKCSNQETDQSELDFKCELCKKPLGDIKSLQKHIIDNHFLNENEKKPEPKPKKKITFRKKTASDAALGRISFKCWMCGETLLCKQSLQRHTFIHGREDGNFELVVNYTQYQGEAMVDTIAIKANPNFVARKSSNVSRHKMMNERTRSPEPEFDPSLPVFSCTECNFKTNEESELTKHKNLHWNSEKDEMFKTNKYFTCGVCFFHCFNVETFIKHSEKHKERPKLNINKITKDGWNF